MFFVKLLLKSRLRHIHPFNITLVIESPSKCDCNLIYTRSSEKINRYRRYRSFSEWFSFLCWPCFLYTLNNSNILENVKKKVTSNQNEPKATVWFCSLLETKYDNRPKRFKHMLFLSSVAVAQKNKTVLRAEKTKGFWFKSVNTTLRIMWTEEEIFSGNWMMDDNRCIAFTGN